MSRWRPRAFLGIGRAASYICGEVGYAFVVNPGLASLSPSLHTKLETGTPFGADPLRIYYMVILGDHAPENASPFQGFSPSWVHVHWALFLLNELPADVLEKSHTLDDTITRRMGGLEQLSWIPLHIDSLEQLETEHLPVFFVCLSGEAEVAARVEKWSRTLKRPILHISTEESSGALHPSKFEIAALQSYCADLIANCTSSFSPERIEAATYALANWREYQRRPCQLVAHGHNVLIPNHMSIHRAMYAMRPGERFIGQSEAAYTEVILESAGAICTIRDDVGYRPLHRMTLIEPEIILTEPAFYRPVYKKIEKKSSAEEKVVLRWFRFLQLQKGLHSTVEGEHIVELQGSRFAQSLIAARHSELETHMIGVGLYAAQSCSAVIRLSPGVNHVFSALTRYGRSIRSNKAAARIKSRRLFEEIQAELAHAVGDARIAFIIDRGGPIKIIADAPIEWLPIGNLPLCLRYNCSRFNATPGNLLMGLLAKSPTITLAPEAFTKILVVSSFADGDPLKDVLIDSLAIAEPLWANRVELIIRRVTKKIEFTQVLNEFDGDVLIFDGHGAGNIDSEIGYLMIGKEKVDIWHLRGTVRVPSIVILSACDTHGIDASTHATVGNGFLHLGSRAVLATLLPVGGNESASFIARMIHRLADFIPAALVAKKRVLNWSEIVGGMLRMLLASEMADELISPPAALDAPRSQILSRANFEINVGDPEWFDKLLGRIAEHRGEPIERIQFRAAGVISRCEAVRYVQLGSPESILVDDGSIRTIVLAEYGQVAPTETET